MAIICASFLFKHHVANYEPPSLKTLTKQGDAVAQFTFGDQYIGMEGTEYHRTAVMWFRKSAEQGYAKSQSALGFRYLESIGVEQDFEETTKWLRKAADQEDKVAQHNLGIMYSKG